MTDKAQIDERETRWRKVDARLARGELDAEGAIRILIESGLAYRANAFPLEHASWTLYVLEPAHWELVPGPRIILQMGPLYGGTRIYKPVRPLLLLDTGAYQTPLARGVFRDPESEK